MAKLIVSRPSKSPFGFARIYHISIDGQRVTAIGEGRKVEIPLSPGRYQVRVRADFMRSQPVQIEMAPEGVHSLSVRWNFSHRKPLTFSIFLTAMAPLACLLDTAPGSWLSMSFTPLILLAYLLLIVHMVIWRDHFLYLEEIPRLDPEARQVTIPRAPRPRPRISIRQMMILVAILAIYLGAATEWGRRERAGFFRSQARIHATLEKTLREEERADIATAVEWEQKGWDARIHRRFAARHAAMADYHAAMKRKYEEAASRRRFLVEPDPPEPTWP